jgi:GH43 family beta-xylosidase
MGYLKVHTKKASGREYPQELALSVHFSWSRDGASFAPLNRGCGVLFAQAEARKDDSLEVKTLDQPAIFLSSGAFAIAARQLGLDGLPDPTATGRLLLWRSLDLIDFEFLGLKREDEVAGYPGPNGDVMRVDDRILQAAVAAWSPYPAAEPQASCTLPFPLAEGHADPVVFRWEDRWLYVSTNDANGNIGFRVRRADGVPALFEPGRAEYLILDKDEDRDLIQTFWAPEFHVIGGRLYLLFAVSGREWGPQCHMMRLRAGGDPTRGEDWEEPAKVLRANGDLLAPAGISLDMTLVETSGAAYFVWSQRWNLGTPRDTGSMLAIALADRAEPWRLASEPVRISRPLFGWENQSGTVNNEGPFALYHEGMIHLAFSGGDARGYAYSIGFLNARADSDLLDPQNWKKAPAPALTSFCLEGQYGPGHCSFFHDEAGFPWMAYHAERNRDRPSACAAIRRVFFDSSGRPRLDFEARG